FIHKPISSGEIRGQLLPDADMYFASNMLGSYEVPVVMTAASGAAAIEIRGNEMVFTGSFSNLEGDFAADVAGGAHIHLAMAGQNGGITFPLVATVAENLRSAVFEAAQNTFTLTEEQLAALQGRRFYINIHSQRSRSGEIRGQIISAMTRTLFRAHLSGSYEVPIVTTSANGMVLAEVFGNGDVQFSGTFNGLESDFAVDVAGGAHIHRGMAGMTGGIIVPFTANTSDNRTGTFPAASNARTLPEEEMTRLFNRGVYVNIHTQNNRSGELRGQLLPEAAINFNGFLSGIFEVPEVATRALGAVKAELNGAQLIISGAFNNLGSPLATDIAGGAHIHLGFAGQTGGIQLLLNTTINDDARGGRFEAVNNTFTLTPEQVTQLRGRQYYVNIHSAQVRSGELRTQLLFEANAYFVAPLSGASETTPVNTTGTGMMVVEANGGNATATGSFANLTGDIALDVAGGAHLHTGFAGQNGPIKQILTLVSGADNKSATFSAGQNTFALSTGFLDTIRNRQIYVNIHSTTARSGEIRGQLLPLATTYFTTTLSASNEVPPLVSSGIGALKGEVTGNRLTLTGRFANLQGAFDPNVAGGAHLHLAPTGQNGPVNIRLATALDGNLLGGTYQATDNTYELTQEQLDALYAGNLYANIHTAFSRSGELRGQLLPELNRFPSGNVAITAPTTGAAITIQGAEDTPFVPTWNAATDRDKLVYIWQLAADDAFNTILFQTIVEGTSLNANFGVVDGLLAAAGVEVGQTITLFHRAIASDGALQTIGTPASVVLTRGVVGQNAEGVDLELSMTASSETYSIFTNTTYEIVVRNTGNQAATNIRIAAGRPEGMVHTSAVVTNGRYRVVIGKWDIDTLAAGATDTLFLTLFALVGDRDITKFVQVERVDQEDVDATPGNNTGTVPSEDDEAVVTIRPIVNRTNIGIASSTIQINSIYPSPTTADITVNVNSEVAMNTRLNIFNANGQLVQQQRINLEKGNNNAYLLVHHWRKVLIFYRWKVQLQLCHL
ncbi:MAG: CHRD domain-containing protein, partial [Saprospiraceae bacterium]|nr:CHRD domain-containing protein [Saprospiraceae bacterium]